MAVTFDSSGIGIQTSTVVAVCTFTIAADACLLVGVATDTNTSISACVVNGTQLTKLGRVAHGGGYTETLYGLTAAPSGVVSISAGLVGGGATFFNIGAVSYLGASQTNPFGTVQTGTASVATAIILSLSTSITDRVVIFASGSNTFTLTNATTRLNVQPHYAFRVGDTAGPASSISLSASGAASTNQILCFMGVNLIASAAPSNNVVSRMMLTGCGD